MIIKFIFSICLLLILRVVQDYYNFDYLITDILKINADLLCGFVQLQKYTITSELHSQINKECFSDMNIKNHVDISQCELPFQVKNVLVVYINLGKKKNCVQYVLSSLGKDPIDQGNQKTLGNLQKALQTSIVSSVRINVRNSKYQQRRSDLTSKIMGIVMKQCRFITSIHLFHTASFSMQHFSNSFTFLKKLQIIHKSQYKSTAIDTEGIRFLAKGNFKSLTKLYISYCQLGNRAVGYISRAQWPSLRDLSLVGCNITDDGLKYLQKHSLVKLDYLGLYRKCVFPSGIKKGIVIECQKLQLPKEYIIQKQFLTTEQWLQQERLNTRLLFCNIIAKGKGLKISKDTMSNKERVRGMFFTKFSYRK